MKFMDRLEAGEKLAEKLPGKFDLVLAIPRGGVVVGQVVADRLGLPLRVVVTKKVGAPGQEELAIGAMGPDGRVVWDEDLMERLDLKEEDLKQQIYDSRFKIKDYMKKFKNQSLEVGGKKVLIVDDGVATGNTMKAAMAWLRRQGVAKIVVAVPVCAQEAYEELTELADEVVCLLVPDNFGAVGQFYEYFPQVTDEEVIDILQS